MASKLLHIFLTVSDLERSVRFYTEAFEGAHMIYEFAVDDRKLYFFDLNNGVVLELEERPEITESDGKWEHVALEVDDIQAQYDRLMAAGARIKDPLNFSTELTGINGCPDCVLKTVHVWGPDGEEIELCQHEEKFCWE